MTNSSRLSSPCPLCGELVRTGGMRRHISKEHREYSEGRPQEPSVSTGVNARPDDNAEPDCSNDSKPTTQAKRGKRQVTAKEKNARKMLALYSNKNVNPYLDCRKLVYSDQFKIMSSFALGYYDETQNPLYIDRLTEIFASSDLYKPILQWLCDQCGLSYQIDKKSGAYRIIFPKTGDGMPRFPIASYLSATTPKGTKEQVIQSLRTKAEKEKAKKEPKPYGDAMYRRYPGSFESGKK